MAQRQSSFAEPRRDKNGLEFIQFVVRRVDRLCATLSLVRFLSQHDTPARRERPDTLGPLLENFVATEILKQATWSDRHVSVFHFRSHIGHDVELVLEDPSGDVVGVEVKAAGSVNPSDFKGLRFLKEALGARFRRGVVLYSGRESIPFGEQLDALPVSAPWRLKAKRAR